MESIEFAHVQLEKIAAMFSSMRILFCPHQNLMLDNALLYLATSSMHLGELAGGGSDCQGELVMQLQNVEEM